MNRLKKTKKAVELHPPTSFTPLIINTLVKHNIVDTTLSICWFAEWSSVAIKSKPHTSPWQTKCPLFFFLTPLRWKSRSQDLSYDSPLPFSHYFFSYAHKHRRVHTHTSIVSVNIATQFKTFPSRYDEGHAAQNNLAFRCPSFLNHFRVNSQDIVGVDQREHRPACGSPSPQRSH